MGVSRGRGASAAPVFLPKQNQLPPSKMHLNNFAMKLVQVVLRMPCSLPPHCPFPDDISSPAQSLQTSTHTHLYSTCIRNIWPFHSAWSTSCRHHGDMRESAYVKCNVSLFA